MWPGAGCGPSHWGGGSTGATVSPLPLWGPQTIRGRVREQCGDGTAWLCPRGCAHASGGLVSWLLFGVVSPHHGLPGALMMCRAHHPLTTRPRAPPCLILLVDGLRFQQEVRVPDHHHHVLELGAEQAAGSGSPCPVPPHGDKARGARWGLPPWPWPLSASPRPSSPAHPGAGPGCI